VTTPIRRCRRPDCTSDLPINPTIWPGDLGFCSAICCALDSIEHSLDEQIRESLVSETTIAAFAGFVPLPKD
jgi:hypothetical protein